jgi:hypothetical protein
MANTKNYGFEEGTAGNALTVAGDYLVVTGTVQYHADARQGALSMTSVNGGLLTLPTPAGDFTVSSYVKMVSLSSGSARIQIGMDSANGFVGFTRMHNTNVFDICDASATRQALSVATWSLGNWYRWDTQFSGTGLTRTIAARVFLADSGTALWDSGPVSVTSATSNAYARLRTGAQGVTTGEVRTDSVRFFDTLEWPQPPYAQFGVPQ